MIIEFPKKYDVTQVTPNLYLLSVPADTTRALLALLNQQPWLRVYPYRPENLGVHCLVLSAYDVTSEQAYDALCKLCEHVMAPDVEVDRDVWNLEA